MVEGPGCTLNGEKIRARVTRGQGVRELRGSAVRGTSQKSPSNALSIPSTCILMSLISCTYTGVQTLGKELFIYFEAKALRVHFGMNGSMRINPAERKDRSGAPAVLEVQLTKDLICFYDSTVDVRNALECQEKVRLFEDLDMCSSKFSFSRAACEVKKQGCRMLCDVLLDQAVLPGVGNIIKNEALFDSGLHPAIQAGLLTDGQISHLVKMTRDFTLLFYKCRKNGSALYKHYKVYSKPNCGQCGTKITVCRLGEHNRMTYFCSKCQKDKPQQLDVSKLPKRNSLIGWACRQESQDEVARSDEEHWACQVCTLINKPSDVKCDACLTPRPQATSAIENDGYDTDLIKYPCNNFGIPLSEIKINRKTAFGHTTLVLSDFSTKTNVDNNEDHKQVSSLEMLVSACSNTLHVSNKRRSIETEQRIDTVNAVHSSSGVSASFVQQEKRRKTDNMTQNFRNEANAPVSSPRVNQTGGTSSPHASSTLCSKHKRPCALHVVRKDGQNKGRQFYSCSLPRESRCEFFEWADLHFPFCKHGKRCIMRTVLKIGPNNGKNFYVCPSGRDKQCDFFEWAKESD
ncbi:PREDICTED: endonuclease 8-like 3 [Nanorana parkeri]|uniref:endonuclease 8-like 3 n=1 Tax=Nanorana parkeri TaxID=125878 RepID=UPI000854D45B|nr:PREDICTED: endonuclease 8-like 3 [Nanorana parkeri]